jgi:hypothetical protein
MMRTTTRLALLVLGFTLALGSDAAAQMRAWEAKGFINVNFGVQSGTHDLEQSGSFPLYDETARFNGPLTVEGGNLLDISGGARLWRNLAVAVTFSRVSDTSDTALTAQIPHPVFFNRPRTATASASGLEHRENAVHIHAMWVQPITDKLDVAIGAGPVFFSVTQQLVTGITVSEGSAPFTTVTIGGAPVSEEKANKTGFSVGADVSFMATRHLGGGFFFRYAVASVDLPALGGNATSLDVGGTQVGGGVRVRF